MEYKAEFASNFSGESDYAMTDALRYGEYSDQYFLNTVRVLEYVSDDGNNERVVEAQIFTRAKGVTVVGGVSVCLDVLRQMTGHWYSEWDGAYPYREEPVSKQWVSTFDTLEVEAVLDGTLVTYGGDPSDIKPVMKIRGVYRDFAAAETVILGILAHVSRVATNVYRVLIAAAGTPVMFYPARFDIPEAQYYDGLAYKIAIDAYNRDYNGMTNPVQPIVSTAMQAASYGGTATGTNPHSLIAAFNGNIVEAMHQYAVALPVDMPRVALVDFRNDCAADSIAVASYYFERYLEAFEADNTHDMKRWTLTGVRLDTSGSHVDRGLLAAGFYDVNENRGVTKELVRFVRSEIDSYANREYFDTQYSTLAWQYFSNIKIIVTGGFNALKIADFINNEVPVDMFGVGSSLLKNDDETNADFTMDVVRIKKNDQWVDVAKVGRAACDNPELKSVVL